MSIIKTGAWGVAARALGGFSAKLKAVEHKAVLREAHLYRKEIVEGIRDGAPGGKQFTPLAPTTIAIRKAKRFGGTKPLIVTGDLRNSIVVVSRRIGEAFVGILRTARGKKGQPLVNLARIHEFGSRTIVIRKTEKMQRFLMLAFRKAGLPIRPGSGAKVIVLRIPPRPFFRPVWDKLAPGAKKRFQAYVSGAMKLLQ